MATDIRTARSLAEEMHEAMTQDTRADGSKFWHLKDGSPQWMTDAAHQAHGDFLPDDYRYEFIVEALSAFVETDDDANVDDMREAIDNIEADIYTFDLLKWLASNLQRPGMVDEAVSEMGHSDMGIVGDIMLGQMAEKHETAYQLLTALENEGES